MDNKKRIDNLYSSTLAFKQAKEIFEIGYNYGFNDGSNGSNNTANVDTDSLVNNNIHNYNDVQEFSYNQLIKLCDNILKEMEINDYATSYNYVAKMRKQSINKLNKLQ